MFNTPEFSRSTFSPFTTRNTSRRSIVTPTTPGQSNRSFVRLNRSQTQTRSSIPTRALEETPLHRVETYGLPLPVQVNEIITTASEKAPPVSVHLDPSGWAWLVFERRLLIWKYRSLETSKVTYCKEFTLPPTELYHTAKLICVVGSPGLDYRQYGVLAVSPEGLVCYWPNMTYESSPIETETELIGQQFHSLVEFQPFGYILATTTNDILLLSIQKQSINCHRFRSPGGVLSGFSRRMSSFIFGSEETSSTTLHKVVVGKNTHGQARSCYILSGNNLREWTVEGQDSSSVNEKPEIDWNVGALFEQQAVERFQVFSDKVRSTCIDAQLCSSGISILSAVVVENPDSEESRMYYFLGTIDVDEKSENFGRLFSLVQLRFAEVYKEEMHQTLLNFNLLLPFTSKQAFVYSDNIIVCSSVNNTEDVLNKVEFLTDGDAIWGSGYSENAVLFFSRKHGIVNIVVTSEAPADDDAERPSAAHLSDSPMPVQGGEGGSDDLPTVLRMAFLQFCQGNQHQAQTMCEESFDNVAEIDEGSVLDAAMASVSKEIVDDYPASDPRWAEAIPADSGSSSASVIIIHQLEDKLKAHDYFVQFLKETMLFDKLHTIRARGRIVCARHLLCECAEKLKFAIALRRQHNKYQELVDNSIGILLKERDQEAAPKGLTQQDLFYREVSRISDIIGSLLDYEKQKLSQHSSQEDHQELVLGVNSILESTLHEAWQYRQTNAALYTSSDGNEPNVEFLPWTASCGPEGVRTLLLQQLEITHDRALSLAEDQKTRSVLIQQMVDLSDIVLDGYVTQINSLRNSENKPRFEDTTQKFEQDRHRLIYPLVLRGYLEEAQSLAEKYRDFDILVEICEENHDQDKLQHYMTLFSNEGFSDFAFKWYMDRGKRSKLMSQPTTQHENLSKFLSSHDHLKWLHDIERQSFYQAYETLMDLAEKEETYLSRKKTLLSLGMLALLSSDESEEEGTIQKLEEINNQQLMISYQETLPADILQSASLDPVAVAPIPPRQLIELFIGDVNKSSDEKYFKNALDVLHLAYGDEEQRDRYEELRLRIWCKAILLDDWTQLEGDDPLTTARNTVFFKTVEIAYRQGFDLALYMPPLESFLAAEELKTAGLTENTTFQFLLRAGYEQILRSQDDTEME